MKSRHFMYYRELTGEFAGIFVSTTDADPELTAKLNCPGGHGWIEGHFDVLAQRVDVERLQTDRARSTSSDSVHATAEHVIEYRPPAPSDDHEWHSGSRRWVLKDSVAAARDRRFIALERIEKLERAQPRALRELALGDESARERLQAIDREIASLRAQLV
jgi:hypothetical protein